MKQLFIFTLLILFFNQVNSQTTVIREVKPFKKIEISGATHVNYIQSDTLKIVVTANEDELNNIVTNFESESLIIKAKGTFKNDYKVTVMGNTLHEIVLTGASKFTTKNTLQIDSIFINASGASSVKADIKTQFVDVLLSGASSAVLDGNTQQLQCTISGASSLKTYKLNTPIATIVASGASYARVFASEKISANATGSSTIKFKGDPKDVSAEASSSSLIAKIADEEAAAKQEKKDSTTINFKNKQYVIISKDKEKGGKSTTKEDNFHHWAGFGMGINGWTGFGSVNLPPGQKYMELNYGKSLNFQLNPFEKDFHIYKNYLNLVTGIGFEWSQYEFANKTKLNADSSYTYGVIDTTNTYSYKKNRFKTTFVDVPLLLEINTSKNPKKAFHVAFGVIGAYRLGSRTRQVAELNGNVLRFIRKDDYNINPFRVNAHASLGYHNFTLYADYALTPLFKTNKGPELYPFTIGIKIITF